jgi:prenyltransferase beta subunit
VRRTLFAGLCLLLVLAPARAQTPEQKKATIAYLRGLQQKDGGFAPAAGHDKSSLRATSAAARVLTYFGDTAPAATPAAPFIARCFDKESGGFADSPGGKVDVPTTAVGLIALPTLRMPVRPHERAAKYLDDNVKGFEQIRIAAAGFEAIHQRPAKADEWLKEIATMRNPDGTYGSGDGKARATGGAVVAVLRLGGKVPHPDAILKSLDAGQREDGAWGKEGAKGSDLDTSYRVMRAYHVLQTGPARPAHADRLRAFIARCRNEDGGYGVAPGQKSSVGGTYYAATILHWLEEKG